MCCFKEDENSDEFMVFAVINNSAAGKISYNGYLLEPTILYKYNMTTD